jgi:FKBP-type peptidyl-prolyl cis-trans isomerase 2
MALNKNDFIEIEFTGRIKDTGAIFDSNIKADLKDLDPKADPKPFVFALGHKMFLDALDEFLMKKEIGKSYKITLNSEKAFGNRDPKAIQIVPPRIFKEGKLNPVPGVVFNFDGRPAKVLSVNGGRIMVDFNHPLAGKELIYNLKILRKVEGKEEQVKAFNHFLFKQDFKFAIKEKKLILNAPPQMKSFLPMFKEKYKEVLGLDLEIKTSEQDKSQNSSE